MTKNESIDKHLDAILRASGSALRNYGTAGKTIDAMRTALAAVIASDGALRSVVSAPTGWRLVPVEPTQEMRAAAMACGKTSSKEEYYCAMLAAAPQPPAQPVAGAQRIQQREGEPMPPAGPVTPACIVCGGCREWGGNGLYHHAGCTRAPKGTTGAWFEAPAQPAVDAAMPVVAWQVTEADGLEEVYTFEPDAHFLSEGHKLPARVGPLIHQSDAQAALAAKDDDYAHGVALLNARIKDLTAERDALAAKDAKHAPGNSALVNALNDRVGAMLIERGEWSAAIKTLQSERDANAVLTGELAAMTAERDALAALAPPVAAAELVATPADMFWNNDDAEQCHASIDDLLNDEWGNGSLEVGAEFEVQQAVRLPNVMIRVTAIDENDDEITYEEIGKTAK